MRPRQVLSNRPVRAIVCGLLLIRLAGGCANSPAPYAVAPGPVPVFNTPEISSVFGGDDGASLRRDESGLVRELEFIALPETAFRLREKILREGTTVYKVETRDYPYHSKNGFFTNSRFFELKKSRPPERARHLPETAKVIQRLLDAEGTGYLWGGNFRGGVPEMLEYYPPAGPLEAEDEAAWSLEGLDCSGLLYEATGGYTPRNARGLVRFGRAVPVQGLDAAAIRGLLEPLDLIVWDTHVIIVLDDERTIQSRLEYKCDRHRPGVRVRPLRLELEELLADRKPVNNYDLTKGPRFTVRRWQPGPAGQSN